MNSICTLTDVLARTHLSDEQRDLVSTVKSSGDAMMRLINDLLLFSKLEAGHIKLWPEPMDLKSFLAPIISFCNHRARSKGLTFSAYLASNTPMIVDIDAMRLRQVLANILDNAVKYTASGHIKLVVYARYRELKNHPKRGGGGAPSTGNSDLSTTVRPTNRLVAQPSILDEQHQQQLQRSSSALATVSQQQQRREQQPQQLSKWQAFKQRFSAPQPVANGSFDTTVESQNSQSSQPRPSARHFSDDNLPPTQLVFRISDSGPSPLSLSLVGSFSHFLF